MKSTTNNLDIQSANSGQFRGVQSLRFFAALMVVIFHSSLYASERLCHDFTTFIWRPGNAGVDVLFVISGFVIATASLKFQARKDGWKEYAARRIIRIVPLYWLLTTLKLIIVILSPSAALHSSLKFLPIFFSYLFLPSKGVEGTLFPFLGVGWTLNFEILFYVVFGFAIYFKKRVLKICAYVMCLLSVLSLFNQSNWPSVSFYFDSIVLEFLFGLIIAKFLDKDTTPNATLSALMVMIGGLLLIFPPDFIIKFPRIVQWGIPATLLVGGVVFLEKPLGQFIPKWLVFMGDTCFALYLIHPFVAPIPPILLKKIGIINFPLSVILSISTSVFAGCILWIAVDKPIYRYLNKIFIYNQSRFVRKIFGEIKSSA